MQRGFILDHRLDKFHPGKIADSTWKHPLLSRLFLSLQTAMGFYPALLDLLDEGKRLLDSSCSSHNQNQTVKKQQRLRTILLQKKRWRTIGGSSGRVMLETCWWLIKRQSNQWTIEHCIRDRTCVPHGDVLCRASAVPLKVLIPYKSSTQIRKARKSPVVMETVSILCRCPRCYRLLRSWQQVNWRNSQFPSCISRIFHTDPARTSSGHRLFSIFIGGTNQYVPP